jgi:hypothetical protein
MSKPFPARYRTTNGPDYIATLRNRGSVLVWLDREMESSALSLGDRPTSDLLGCGHPVLPQQQGPVRLSAAAIDWDGGKPVETGRLEWPVPD